jgi:Transposase IS66 family
VSADELIDTLAPQQLRQALRSAQQLVVRQEREVAFKQAAIDKLTHEMAVLKRLKFAAKSEAYGAEQKSLIEETLDADLAGLAAEMLQQRVLHADETPVAMLKPANQRGGKTHRVYLWSYCTTSLCPVRAVVFDFADSRGGQHVRAFLGLPGSEHKPGWNGKLVTDDFSGYKACYELGVTEVGCMAHARRKFHELWVHHQSALD